MDEELLFHLEKQTEKNIAAGMNPTEAREAAHLSFGRMDGVKVDCRESWGVRALDELVHDTRYGLRQLRRNPGFTIAAVLTLALGIGATVAIFSVANAIILRPLPYANSNRLVWIDEYLPSFKLSMTGGADFVDWQNQSHTLAQITAFDRNDEMNLSGRATPLRVHAVRVSGSFFATFGVTPQIGREFTAAENRPNGGNVAILMHSFWQAYYGSDPAMIGRTIDLNATPYTVVGVMPAGFKFPGYAGAQVLVPLQLDKAREALRVRQTSVQVVGLLKPGVTVAQARTELDTIMRQAQAEFLKNTPSLAERERVKLPQVGTAGGSPAGPNMMQEVFRQSRSGGGGAAIEPVGGSRQGAQIGQATPAGGKTAGVAPAPNRTGVRSHAAGGNPKVPRSTLRVMPLSQYLAGDLRPAILIMLGIVALVLLIACANVADLMLARGAAQTRDVAVRAALGAGRGRIVRQLLTESTVIALIGGVVGVLLAVWGVSAITELIPPNVGGSILSLDRPRVDGAVLLFALGVSVVTGILFGLVPALTASRTDLVEHLKEGAQAVGGRHGKLRGALVVAELALALVVLIGAGLLVNSLRRAMSVDLGFSTQGILTMDLALPESSTWTPNRVSALYSSILRSVESLPGVRSAAAAGSLPLHTGNARKMMLSRRIADRTGGNPSTTVLQMTFLSVSPAYFTTLGIPVLEGRTFTDQDTQHSANVVVINEAMAKAMWPNQDPIGKQLPVPAKAGPSNGALRVVGVVGNTRRGGPTGDIEPVIYQAYSQSPSPVMQLAIRSAVAPTSLVPAIRRAVSAVDPELPLSNVTTMNNTLAELLAPRSFNMLLMTIFAAIALILATIGIYGIMAYTVVQRTHEVGIRMALGADAGAVVRLILTDGLKLIGIGIVIGVGGALVFTRFLSSLLYGVTATDPATYVVVSLALAVVAMAASYVPARRATKVDPMVALRYE